MYKKEEAPQSKRFLFSLLRVLHSSGASAINLLFQFKYFSQLIGYRRFKQRTVYNDCMIFSVFSTEVYAMLLHIIQEPLVNYFA